MLPLKDIVHVTGRAENQPHWQRWTQGGVRMHLLHVLAPRLSPELRKAEVSPGTRLWKSLPHIPTFSFPSQMIPVNLSPSFLYFVVQATYLLWVSSI